MDKDKIKQGVQLIIEGIGEDASREGLVETPDRIARMYEEIFAGLNENASVHLSKTFSTQNTDMIIEKDITFYSMCEHHFLPFYGKAHIAYIPNGRVAGLSKLARTVEVYARRPQLQERMTVQIADAIMENLDAKGAMVIIEAEHMCMTMRGIKKPGSRTVTISSKGIFTEDAELRNTFLTMAGAR
ncbi:MAG TPA: GTP cyclohydrolase I FolE [Lachnospiraceae bacterium]|jgi:GTP cyclohydrolase I|nr:GTP cyclohydrolase I FolE [Lachnospiraceae bacterium]